MREFTPRETRIMFDIWRRLLWPKGGGFSYVAIGYLWYGFAAFLALSVIMAATRLQAMHADVAAQLVTSALGFAVCSLFLHRASTKSERQVLARGERVGDRYRLEAQGLRVDIPDASDFCGWPSIVSLHNSDRWLILLQARGGAMMLARDAFEGQDFTGFRTELERRWAQHRAAAVDGKHG